MTNQLPDVAELLKPVSAENPCGEDMSFSQEFDTIQEARRQDDASLDQGEWVTSIKEADWKLSGKVCAELLRERTKDLRLASWLTESLAQTHQIAGLTRGLQITEALLNTYWDTLHPLAEDNDQEQRIGNLSWLVARGVQLVKILPLVRCKNQNFGLTELEGARALQALLDRGQAPDDNSLARRTTQQQFRDAQRGTPRSFYQQTLSDCSSCLEALQQLANVADARLGLDGPSFQPLRNMLESYTAEIERMARENGVGGASPITADSTGVSNPELGTESPSSSLSGGPLQHRTQALAQLREVAEFFRRTEPHSPVAYLADKAANWGEMPLHVWLKAVLKENGSLSRFEDLLGFNATDSED